MSIVRAPRPDRGFTILDNNILRDTRLSYRARGVLAAILSRPDNWRTDSTQLAHEGKEGREAIRTALNELEACGYLTRTKERSDGGRWVTITTVYDTPRIGVDVPAGRTGDGFPGVGSPGAGNPGAVRSTETKNLDEDEPSRVTAAAETDEEREPTNWREADRARFLALLDSERITVEDPSPWGEGTYSTTALYEAFRKGAGKMPAKRWPGMYLEGLEDWEDYLNGLGVYLVS